MTDFRVIVTGSRHWPDPARVLRELKKTVCEECPEGSVFIVVHGANPRGADAAAAAWCADLAARLIASMRGVTLRQECHPAPWDARGPAAGPFRNQEMVDAGADLVLAFVMPCTLKRCAGKPEHVTHGTRDCITRAEKAGIAVRRIGT